MQTLDWQDRNVITGRDLEAAIKAGATELKMREGALLTSTAREIIRASGIQVLKAGGSRSSSVPSSRSGSGWSQGGTPEALFRSAETQTAKEEMVNVGHKLWKRGFVDGNGGNISYRLNDQYVLCTPTLMSKGDLTVDDLCLVDMEGKQLAGKRPRTSEVLMHLEIYKSNSKAKACVHAHPPHATAYAITGTVPPNCIIPEEEVFVGLVAITPYETPGTKAFADRVIPLVKDHNTILLGNHGVVCWADTITHAEWYLEVVDTYCHTLILASQLGVPITRISESHTKDLLAIKKKLDLPDPRFSGKECSLCDMPDTPGGITVCPKECHGGKSDTCSQHDKSCSNQGTSSCCGASKSKADPSVETLVQRITDEVMAVLKLSN